jgi:hypothetical protein
MFVGKAGAYLSEAHFMCSLLALETNIKLDRKPLTGTHTLAYYEH